jgi:hypothetical protein
MKQWAPFTVKGMALQRFIYLTIVVASFVELTTWEPGLPGVTLMQLLVLLQIQAVLLEMISVRFKVTLLRVTLTYLRLVTHLLLEMVQVDRGELTEALDQALEI